MVSCFHNAGKGLMQDDGQKSAILRGYRWRKTHSHLFAEAYGATVRKKDSPPVSRLSLFCVADVAIAISLLRKLPEFFDVIIDGNEMGSNVGSPGSKDKNFTLRLIRQFKHMALEKLILDKPEESLLTKRAWDFAYFDEDIFKMNFTRDATAQGDLRYNDQLPINIDKDFISGEVAFYNSVQKQLENVDYKALSDEDKVYMMYWDYL
ncbi:hypothetical protein FQA39_LY18750 [Lamprigera yunnana]|nr:hypothetical protein FQA39_LY18750 [Lamprigera yunnana]